MKETLCWTCQRAGTSTGCWETFDTYNVEDCPLRIDEKPRERPQGCHTPNKIDPKELERLLNQGYTAEQCAELLDVCVGAIYYRRRKLDGKTRHE